MPLQKPTQPSEFSTRYEDRLMIGMQCFIVSPPSGMRRVRQALFTCMISAITLIGSALSTTQVAAQYVEPDDIAPFEIVFSVSNHILNAGTAKLVLSREKDFWSYSLTTKPRGILKLAGKGHIREFSTLRFADVDGDLQFQTQTYLYRQDKERKRSVDARFDWDARSIAYTYRGKESTETFKQPVIDRLSATLLMMDTLRKGDFTSTVLNVFDNGDIKDVTFKHDGVETLDTPLGKIETIRVINFSGTGGNRETITWFAPSLDYVPVKIEHSKRGDLVVRLKLMRVNNRVTDVVLDHPSD